MEHKIFRLKNFIGFSDRENFKTYRHLSLYKELNDTVKYVAFVGVYTNTMGEHKPHSFTLQTPALLKCSQVPSAQTC
jgi:hypothetical protein